MSQAENKKDKEKHRNRHITNMLTLTDKDSFDLHRNVCTWPQTVYVNIQCYSKHQSCKPCQGLNSFYLHLNHIWNVKELHTQKQPFLKSYQNIYFVSGRLDNGTSLFSLRAFISFIRGFFKKTSCIPCTHKIEKFSYFFYISWQYKTLRFDLNVSVQ